jgi:hypothetical protein
MLRWNNTADVAFICLLRLHARFALSRPTTFDAELEHANGIRGIVLSIAGRQVHLILRFGAPKMGEPCD